MAGSPGDGDLTVQVLLFIGGVGVLYFGAEWLVRGAGRLASRFGVSPMVVGLTVVSLGTSAPELFVSVLSALRGQGDLAIANVMGSNLANIGLILGISALIRPLAVSGRVIRREVWVMLGVTALLYPVILDLHLSRIEGVLLLGVLVAYLFFILRTVRWEKPKDLGEFEQFAKNADLFARGPVRDLALVALGGAGLMLGAQAIVSAALEIADIFSIPPLVIGVTALALGTSLPELATSAVAAYRGEADIAVGNIIGSNVFNIAAVLGTTAVIAPIDISGRVLDVEFPAVLLMTLLLIPIVRSQQAISRAEGAVLVLAYFGMGYWVIH